MRTASPAQLIGVLLLGISVSATGVEVVDKYPDGTVQDRYSTDSKGLRTGPYASFYADGKKHETGTYRNDQKQGDWTSYDEKGKVLTKEKFQAGSRNGLCITNVDGKLRLKMLYAKGELSSPIGVFDKNGSIERLVSYPMSLPQLTQQLTILLAPAAGEAMTQPASLKAPYACGKVSDAIQNQALRALQAIRMLTGAPWADMQVDAQASDIAQHSALLTAVDNNFHDQPKPADMEADFYAPCAARAARAASTGPTAEMTASSDPWATGSMIRPTSSGTGAGSSMCPCRRSAWGSCRPRPCSISATPRAAIFPTGT